MTTATKERLELSISRTFNAPTSAVWEIWAKREHMIRWWGPKDFETTHLELDFRVGGAYRACIYNDDYGGENWMSGRFVELVPNERILMTFKWEQDEAIETLITITFTEQDGKTTQTFHQTPFRNAESRDSHIGGWTSFIEKEQAYVERLAKGDSK